MGLRSNFIISIVILLLSLVHRPAVSQEVLTVRSGDHPNYSRVVFDWTRNVVYSAELVGDKVDVSFSANAVPDFTAMLMDGPTFLSNPTHRVASGRLIVSFDAYEGGTLRHFRSGTKIVIDLLSVAAAQPTEVSVAASAPAEMVEVAPAAIEPQQRGPLMQPANFVDGQLNVQARETSDAFIIDYIWDDDVKAAAFIRAGHLWVVFDKVAQVNHGNIEEELGGRVKSADHLSNLSPTILTYAIEPDQNARMEKMVNGWQVSLRSNVAVPQIPIEIGHQSISSVGENIFLMAGDLGNVINIEDPFIGDSLTIVPAAGSSQGVLSQNNYTEFNILKSAQGIALQLVADDIFVTRHETGVAVSGQNGLAVSRSSIPLLRGALPVAMDDVGEAGQVVEDRLLLDFAAWEVGPLEDEGYVKNRHELLYRISGDTNSERNEARWNLALYNLAHNNVAESFGILELMGASEPGFLENPSYRAVLAVANIKMRRFDEAIELLSHKSLVAELDARLWRSLAYEAKGEYQKAMDDFNLGIDVLALQNNDHRAAFLFASLRAGSALGDVENMNNRINSMQNISLNAKQLSELDYWRGRMAEQYGDEEVAAQEYDKVIAAGVRYPAALAKMARVNQRLRLNEIEPMQAVDELEKLRFAWRGDDFELDLLKQLGTLYVDNSEFRDGLSTLRQAATYFPRSPKTSGLTREMSEIYNDLFLNGGADNMAPLSAMALFLEFRELTPLGADGDTMSRNLASRMVGVDLLNDAAELLEFQVENRLKGVARADIAIDLSKIYLMNKEAEKAIQILRSTRQSQVPEDIEYERRMVEIRALVELDQFEEAEVMLEGDNSDVAQSLRSDIYWNTDDWRRVVDHGYGLLNNRWQDSAELSAEERQIILRIAVALALDEDLGGLESLRSQYIDHMQNGIFDSAFEIITAKEQKTGEDIRALTQTIASVDRLETFMDSYRNDFALNGAVN